MKTYSLEELRKLAAEHFSRLQVSKLYATADAQFFLLESRAKLHAGASGKVYPLESEEDNSTPVEKPLTAAEVITKAMAMTTLDELNALLAEEVAGANRATAVKAIEKQIQTLSAE